MSVFWKQRDNQFFPTACFVLPTTILRLPYSGINALMWSVIVYWATGLTYSAGRYSYTVKCRNIRGWARNKPLGPVTLYLHGFTAPLTKRNIR